MDARTIALVAIPAAVVLIPLVVWLLARRTIRTRRQMARQFQQDPQINDWMVEFGWSDKILYLPTVVVSLIVSGLMAVIQANWLDLGPHGPQILGGVWLSVFFLNFLIDEYEVNLKILFLALLAAALLILWLVLANLLNSFLQLFTHLRVEISAVGYLLIAAIFAMAILSSWLHGLFYYAAITPNYVSIQNGPTESSEQISREYFSTRIDTGDFLERLMGFGRIVIQFQDARRPNMSLLVWRIGQRAAKLESIRAHLAVENVSSGNDRQA